MRKMQCFANSLDYIHGSTLYFLTAIRALVLHIYTCFEHTRHLLPLADYTSFLVLGIPVGLTWWRWIAFGKAVMIIRVVVCGKFVISRLSPPSVHDSHLPWNVHNDPCRNLFDLSKT